MTTDTATEAQRRLDDLLEHLPAGVIVHDTDGRVSSANRRACELLDMDLKQMKDVEPGAWRLLDENGKPMTPEQFPINVVLRSGRQIADAVVGIPDEKGEARRWVICNAYLHHDAADVAPQVVVCFTDCTPLKLVQQRLQVSEERLRLALRGSTDAPWDYDLLKNEIHYSERWCDMFDYPFMATSTDTNFWRGILHPDDRARVEGFMDELLAGLHSIYSIEFRMRHRDGHYLPILVRGFVSRDASGKPVRITGTNTDLTERKEAEQRIYELAYFDHLTGLPNRRLLAQELDKVLARSRRSGRFSAVVFLDLDNFKLLNDTMGHDVGDMLLRQVGERLRRTLRHSDQLARLGGDEFIIVLEDLGSAEHEAVTEANHVLDKVQAVLRQPYHLAGRAFASTPSMGVVLFDGNAADIDTLLKQGDLAMYQAKSDGRNTVRFFDPEMQATAEHQAALERALGEGLGTHQFELFCQPQFSSLGKLVGAEVLVRWRHPSGELLGPDQFIGVAESSGLIVPLGQYVLEESCRTLARWQRQRCLGTLELAVNVSAHQLRSGEFAGKVADILKRTGAPAAKLCLELTESVFAENVGEIIDHMHALCRHGVHFSLDDFGTGYSSLAYLRHFPLAALKIDRSFVQDVHLDPDAAPIVEAIIALARTLKLDIVAEGVEYEEQRAFLVGGGCGTLQGYLLGRPVPIREFERLYGHA